jgi:pilus assembly protein CpaE
VRARAAPAAAAPRQRGQASVELLGALPLLIALGLAALQLLAVGYASVLAGNAAEAGALALAGASSAAEARAGVREALPGWSRARTQVSVAGGRVTVRLRPPALLPALSERLEVSAEAAVEAP